MQDDEGSLSAEHACMSRTSEMWPELLTEPEVADFLRLKAVGVEDITGRIEQFRKQGLGHVRFREGFLYPLQSLRDFIRERTKRVGPTRLREIRE